ncbi:MAG: sigma 54-interacting transcriptional regulator, partial [Oligoflexia bacterium]|nr:sigma 54-interacting transcriptional regulator [Oligoflexia bacterium]
MTEQVLKNKILVIEDEEYFRKSIVRLLSPMALITEVSNKEDALRELRRNYFDAVIIDIDLNGIVAGFDILTESKNKGLYSIMLTDNNSDEYITKAYSIGCDHYLTKEQSEQVLIFIIKERLSVVGDVVSAEFFKKNYVTQDQTLISDIISLKKRLKNDRPLLLLGPTGVGKTKLAEQIHFMLGGNKDNFVSLNIASTPDNLIENELFGYHKGAFAGATKDKKGVLEKANGGTLFLDEITCM